VAQSKAQIPQHSQFKEASSLQALGELSQQKQLPILLMFGAESCEYCKLLVSEVLEPMALSGLYDGKVVIMRHVGIDEPALIPDWNGNPIKKSQWAYQLNADLTPTVLFMNASGKEVAPRIIGISEITLYTGLIHQRLNTAYQNMGLTKDIPATPELLYQQTRTQ
jgi:thioredoxin-related protein